MRNFLVVGLESSCTRHVSVLIASNLGFYSGWDGHNTIEDDRFIVVHKSLPHGSRDSFISQDYWMSFDTVALCTRDMHCSLKSKMGVHQYDLRLARLEQETGRKIASKILATHPRVEIYSYESAFLIGRQYNEEFFKRIDVPYTIHMETVDANHKYFSDPRHESVTKKEPASHKKTML